MEEILQKLSCSKTQLMKYKKELEKVPESDKDKQIAILKNIETLQDISLEDINVQ
jgi:hypothetical protein